MTTLAGPGVRQPFRVPTRVVIEDGCVRSLVPRLGEMGISRVLLVLDAGVAPAPWAEAMQQDLALAGIGVELVLGVESNPRADTIEAMAGFARRGQVKAVVGVGGGSVLDAAKAAAMLATNGGRCLEYQGKNVYSQPPLPFIAVPTTCGTGSEVTWVSVITVPEQRAKISVKGETMFPVLALVDPDLLVTLPRQLVAWTALDALTHALEACTGRLANPASDALATEAVRLLLEYLPRAVADVAGDGAARRAVMTASTLAGLAFGNADVAAVHCLSETLGGLYDLPHGLANAVLLGPVLRSHGAAVEAPLARLEQRLGAADPGATPAVLAERLLARVEALATTLDVASFATFGVPPEDFPEIARRAVANGSNASNPRPMAAEDYLDVLRRL